MGVVEDIDRCVGGIVVAVFEMLMEMLPLVVVRMSLNSPSHLELMM